MEQLIANLLVSDDAIIAKATADLQEAYKRTETVPALCDIVVSHPEIQFRQFAAVLLRKRLGKLRNWNMVSPETQAVIKQGMLQALLVERERPARNAIAHLVGVLVRHEFAKKDPWMNEVLKFIFEHCSSSDPNQSELGSSTFSILTDAAPDQFIPHMESICDMFSSALVATEASGNMTTPVILNIVVGMTNLIPFVLGHNAAEATYQKAIPYIVKCLHGFALQDADKFCEAFEILDVMAEYVPKLLNSNLKMLIDFCLEAAQNNTLDDRIRVRCVMHIGTLLRLKKKMIIKQKMVEPIIQVVFHVMATATEDDEDEEPDDEDFFSAGEGSNPTSAATQTMDMLALNVPPEKLIPPLLVLLEPALKSEEPMPRKASYLCLAMIAEGCSEAICNKYIRPLLDCVKVGITDGNTIVRNAAFFALGQFSEHLQPTISEFAPEILPILFEYLHQLCIQIKSGLPEPKHLDKLFYALETFCENLDEEAFVPHLPMLMERLFEALDPHNSVRLRELALSCVSSTAMAAKTYMLPYFERLVEGLKPYLIKTDDDDIMTLQPSAVDALASLTRTIGKENFLPLAQHTIDFCLAFTSETEDPDTKRSVYNLIAAMSEVLGTDLQMALPHFVERMIESVSLVEIDQPDLTQQEGENGAQDISIEDSDGEDDDDEITGFNVENAFLDEKEEAIIALKELALNCGLAFTPFLQKCFEVVYTQINNSSDDIRKVSVDALTQFVISLNKSGDAESTQRAVQLYVSKLIEIVHKDEETSVVMTALESLSQLLIELKQNCIFTDELKGGIFSCIQDVFNTKVACQFDDPFVGDEEEDESEYDEAIMELAGEVLPKFGQALCPEEFALYFGRVVQTLVKKIEKTQNREELESQRAFAFGTLSECFKPLQKFTSNYFDTFLPHYIQGVQDNSKEVRHNAVFGLGELVLYSEEKSYGAYPQILQCLSHAVSQQQAPGTLDNICGALARLIITNFQLVPLEQVLPVFVQQLPLREDFDENNAIFKCFLMLLTQNIEALNAVIDKVMTVGFHVLMQKQFKEDDDSNTSTYKFVVNVLCGIRAKYPEVFNNYINSDAEVFAFASQHCSA